MYQALNVSGKIKNRTEKNTIGTSIYRTEDDWKTNNC